jgi:hypothetical protein
MSTSLLAPPSTGVPSTSSIEGPTWEVSCIADDLRVALSARGSALEAARSGLDAVTAAHPELPPAAWRILTTHRDDCRVTRHGWRVDDDEEDEGRLVEVRREFWVESA